MAESCVIDCPKPIPAVSDSPDLPQTTPKAEQVETLETAPLLESGENYTSAPNMKGLCVLSGTTAPQGQSCPAEFLGGESEGGEADAAPTVEQGENLQAEEVSPEITTDPLPLATAPREILDKTGQPLNNTSFSGTEPGATSGCPVLSSNLVTPIASSVKPKMGDEAAAGDVTTEYAKEVPPAAAAKVTTKHAPRFFLDKTGQPHTTPITRDAQPTTQEGCPVLSGDFVTLTLDPELSRVTKIRLEAICKAQAAVRMQGLLEGRRFGREERVRRETIAKMRHFWESGEPVLMREAQEWAAANPGALPEVMPKGEEAPAAKALAARVPTLASPASPKAVAIALEPVEPLSPPANPEAADPDSGEPAAATTPEAVAPTPEALAAITPTSTADPPANAPTPANPEASAPRPRKLPAADPRESLCKSGQPSMDTSVPHNESVGLNGCPDLPRLVVAPSADDLSPSPTDEPLKVGSRVIWDNCPAHCASWNPFTIIRIEDGMAWLDIYEKPVPLSDLRRARGGLTARS